MRVIRWIVMVDKTTIIYNEHITITGIPIEAYNYKLNGRSIIEQFMNFYRFKKDPSSGITNDPNDFLKQTSPDYFLTTLLRLIAISLKHQNLITKLPTVNFNNPKNLEKVPN